MRRPITAVGSQVYEWIDSADGQNTMTAIAKVCAAIFGTAGFVNGLAATPTSPATLTVNIGAGEIYQQASLEATACGTLPQNTTYSIVKQGIQLGTSNLSGFTAPATSGQSINYLICAQYQDSDISLDPTSGNTPVVLQFYNSTNPTTPWSGPNNAGSTSNTFRDGIVALSVVAGVAATTGSQTTPSPTAGYVGLWVVTVAYGQTTITASNVTQYQQAPILPTSVLQSVMSGNMQYGIDAGSVNVVQATFAVPTTTLADNQPFWVKIKNTNTGATTFTPNPGVIAASPVIGAAHAALQGGELLAGGRALLVWKADVTSYVLIECTGAAVQVANATQPQHAVTMGQVGSLVASPNGARSSLSISYTGTTGVVSVTANALTVQTAAGAGMLLKSLSLSATSGNASGTANSLDTGSWAYSTWYNLFVIYSPTTTTSALLWSLSATAPTLPSGYTYFARIGANKTQSATNYWFLGGSQLDRIFQYKVNSSGNLTSLPLMSSGAQGNVSTPTWVAVAVSPFIPTTAGRIAVTIGQMTTASQALLAPNNSYGGYASTSNPPPFSMSGGSGATPPVSTCWMTLESTSIYIATGSTSGGFYCFGWEDSL